MKIEMKISYFLKEANTSLYTCHLYEIVEILRYLTSRMKYIPLDSSPPFAMKMCIFLGKKVPTNIRLGGHDPASFEGAQRPRL